MFVEEERFVGDEVGDNEEEDDKTFVFGWLLFKPVVVVVAGISEEEGDSSCPSLLDTLSVPSSSSPVALLESVMPSEATSVTPATEVRTGGIIRPPPDDDDTVSDAGNT